MEQIIIKYSNLTALANRLNALDVPSRQGTDPNGVQYRIEDFMGRVSTPHLEDINGDFYFSTRLDDGDADKMPNNDHNPAFTIIWRDTETDQDGNLLPWPEVEVQAYDIDGNPSGTRMQGVGRIA